MAHVTVSEVVETRGQAVYVYALQEDFRVCLAHGIIQRDSPLVCPVDATGCFTAEVTDFAGQYVKDADKSINRWLKDHGRLVLAGQSLHSYPFCYRSETPLIYKAVPSWFVRVEPMVSSAQRKNTTRSRPQTRLEAALIAPHC